MKSRFVSQLPRVFMSKLNYLYLLGAVLLAGGMCAVQVYDHGLEALWLRCWGWYLFAFVAGYVLVVPRMRVDLMGVEVVNPYRSHRLSLSALTDVSAHYYLMVEGRKKYRAFGVLGVVGQGMRTMLDLAQDEQLTAMTYRGRAIRHTPVSGLAGEAASLIIGRWQEAEDRGELEGIPVVEQSRTSWGALAVTLVLGALFICQLLGVLG